MIKRIDEINRIADQYDAVQREIEKTRMLDEEKIMNEMNKAVSKNMKKVEKLMQEPLGSTAPIKGIVKKNSTHINIGDTDLTDNESRYPYLQSSIIQSEEFKNENIVNQQHILRQLANQRAMNPQYLRQQEY